MAKSLAQIQAQIEKLKREEEQLVAKERAGVIERIKVAIAHYGLTAVDLGLAKTAGRKPGSKNKVKADAEAAASTTSAKKGRTKKTGAKSASKPKAAKAPSIAKYSDGAGNSWTGNGKRPRWFLDAIAGGKSAEDLLIKPAE